MSKINQMKVNRKVSEIIFRIKKVHFCMNGNPGNLKRLREYNFQMFRQKYYIVGVLNAA